MNANIFLILVYLIALFLSREIEFYWFLYVNLGDELKIDWVKSFRKFMILIKKFMKFQFADY